MSASDVAVSGVYIYGEMRKASKMITKKEVSICQCRVVSSSPPSNSVMFFGSAKKKVERAMKEKEELQTSLI